MNEDLIRQFFSGECSEEEIEMILDWVKSKNPSDPLSAIYDKLWEDDDTTSYEKEIDSKQLFDKIEQTQKEDNQDLISLSETQKLEITQPRSLPNRKIMFLRYAAILIFGAVFSYVLVTNKQPEVGEVTVEMVKKVTTRGQKSTIFLRDGSKVILNSESSIAYPKYFTDSSRVLNLDGEAYFDVAEDKKRPFTVISKGISTIALGTSFTINGRTDGNALIVNLESGKLLVKKSNEMSFSDDKNLHFLNPGEAIKYDQELDQIFKSAFDYKDAFLWKEGIIYFKDASFDEVLEKLGAWYNVQFEVENKHLAKKYYTGEFKNESLENLLENISYSLNFDYFLNDKNVKIIFN